VISPDAGLFFIYEWGALELAACSQERFGLLASPRFGASLKASQGIGTNRGFAALAASSEARMRFSSRKK
jgi:hypothetical protein